MVISPTPHVPWRSAFLAALPHGLVAGVHLPPGPEPVPPEVLRRLHPEELAYASTLGGFRQVQFVGGRLALADLFNELGVRRTPVLPDAYGAPAVPAGLLGSVSHKHSLAVAILARGEPGLGIDLEDTSGDRPGVARRVLRPEELAAVDELPPERRWCDTALRFSVKEAVYKALHPYLRRYIGFGEVAVWPSPDGNDRVDAFLQPGEGPFRFDARHVWLGSHVISTVRVRPA